MTQVLKGFVLGNGYIILFGMPVLYSLYMQSYYQAAMMGQPIIQEWLKLDK